MKTLTPLFVIFLLACGKAHEKDLILNYDGYLEQVKAALKDSLPQNDFSRLDFMSYKKNSSGSGSFYCRIPLVDAEREFVFLKTDSMGHILVGSKYQIDFTEAEVKKSKGRGRILRRSLSGAFTSSRTVSLVIGRAGDPEDDEDALPDMGDDPAFSLDLPTFICVGQAAAQSVWVFVPEMTNFSFPEFDVATYLRVDPPKDVPDVQFAIETEVAKEGPAVVDIQKLFKCFEYLASQGASYTVQLCADIPVNTLPSFPGNLEFSPGHTFLVMKKSNGTSSVTQVLGFYPGADAAPGVIVNDSRHEINAAIEMPVTEAQFTYMLAKAVTSSKNNYNLVDYNCANFALSVFNSVRSSPIDVDPFPVSIESTYPMGGNTAMIGQSPQKLYEKLAQMKSQGGPEASAITISNYHNNKAPDGKNECI